jgi:hypothetical protein
MLCSLASTAVAAMAMAVAAAAAACYCFIPQCISANMLVTQGRQQASDVAGPWPHAHIAQNVTLDAAHSHLMQCCKLLLKVEPGTARQASMHPVSRSLAGRRSLKSPACSRCSCRRHQSRRGSRHLAAACSHCRSCHSLSRRSSRSASKQASKQASRQASKLRELKPACNKAPQ